MGLPSLDLNLLVALHALLAERNVTRAGERIGLSQPATSAALARLRRHFDDELLQRVGSRYELTPLASSLLEQSQLALRYVENTFAARPVFNAAVSTRGFSILASDYALIVLGGTLGRLMQERAPNVRLHINNLDRHLVDDAANTLRIHDAMLLPKGYVSDLAEAPLFEDDWVILASTRPGREARVLDLDELSTARWVTTYDSPTQFTPADKTLRFLGIERRSDIIVENFASLPFLVRDTDRLALVPRRLAHTFGRVEGIEQLEPPVSLPQLSESLWWHPSRETDPGHRWLLDIIIDAADQIGMETRNVPR